MCAASSVATSFDKVEMYKFTTPDRSYEALEELVQHASDICDALGLRYRRVEMVTGDLGFAATKKFDLECWAPGCQEWLEISSCSNCEDFQARRANVKFRPAGGGRYSVRPHAERQWSGAAPCYDRHHREQSTGGLAASSFPRCCAPYMGGPRTHYAIGTQRAS